MIATEYALVTVALGTTHIVKLDSKMERRMVVIIRQSRYVQTARQLIWIDPRCIWRESQRGSGNPDLEIHCSLSLFAHKGGQVVHLEGSKAT